MRRSVAQVCRVLKHQITTSQTTNITCQGRRKGTPFIHVKGEKPRLMTDGLAFTQTYLMYRKISSRYCHFLGTRDLLNPQYAEKRRGSRLGTLLKYNEMTSSLSSFDFALSHLKQRSHCGSSASHFRVCSRHPGMERDWSTAVCIKSGQERTRNYL